MSIIVKGSGGGAGGEDLTAVLTEQDALILEIEESLVGKASGANITPETVLAGYRGYRGKTLVEGTYNPATADPDLIPNNIRKGVDIFGIIGSMVEGAVGIDFGEVTSTGAKGSITVNHNLGVTPSQIYLIPKGSFTVDRSYTEDYIATTNYVMTSKYIDSSSEGFKKNNASHSRTSTTITFKSGTTFRPLTYYWIAIA